MGPRSRERGNEFWHIRLASARSASMGPRSRERGNQAQKILSEFQQGASMGPRSRERGNGMPSNCLRIKELERPLRAEQRARPNNC